MKKILFTFLFLAAFMAGFTQMSNQGSITVMAGANLVVEGSYTTSNSGSIDIDGGMVLKGDFVNNGGQIATGSDGSLTFDGTTAQQIRGTQSTTFNCDVNISNPAGVSLVGFDQEITGDLTFTEGVLALGNYNLTVGAASTMTRTSGHVNATGTGEFRKKFSSATAYTLPLGDATNYTPVAVSFNSGTFGTGAYVGSRLVDAAHPNLPTTDDYLTRYWKLNSSGITDINCNLTFNYIPGDAEGTAANMYAVKYLGNGSWKNYNVWASGNQLTASNVDGFSDWTGSGKIALTLDLKAYLQGPYDVAGDSMITDLNPYIPLDQPFDDGTGSELWYYTGTESVASVPADATDWVLIEFRHAATPDNATSSTLIGRSAGFLKKNGSVVALNGTSNLNLDAVTPFNDNLYVAVYQRNHVGIMSNDAVIDDNNDGIFTYDYTLGSEMVYGGTAGYKQLTTGIWGMVAGDATGDGNIYVPDYSSIFATQFGSTGGYFAGDFSLDGNVYVPDYSSLFAPNFGITGPMPMQVMSDLSNVPLLYKCQIPR